jgi:hypothetical protein
VAEEDAPPISGADVSGGIRDAEGIMWMKCEYCGNEADASEDGGCRKCGAPKRRGDPWGLRMGMCAGTAVDMPISTGIIYGGSALWIGEMGQEDFAPTISFVYR